jgi:hypothetical protein
MPRKCSICLSKNRCHIDECLTKGVSYRDIARQFNVSKDAVERHVNKGHVSKIIKAAAIENDVKTGLNIQKCAQDIYDLCFRAAQKAESQDLRSLGSCIAPAVKVLEILNKGNEGNKDPPKESAFWKSYRERAGEVFDKQT